MSHYVFSTARHVILTLTDTSGTMLYRGNKAVFLLKKKSHKLLGCGSGMGWELSEQFLHPGQLEPRLEMLWTWTGQHCRRAQGMGLWGCRQKVQDSLEKTLMLGKSEDRRRRGRQRMVGWHH